VEGQLLSSRFVPPASWASLAVRTGHTLRVVIPDGPQVVDMDVFNLHDSTESFCSSITRTYNGIHLELGQSLFSCSPWERPMLTMVADTVRRRPSSGEGILFGTHDLLYGRCTRQLRLKRYGLDSPGCQENLAEGLREAGLLDTQVHDPLNIFMKTGLDPSGHLVFGVPDARAGDYVDMRAEMDCLAVVSTCPGRSSGLKHHRVVFEIYANE
jgi:uncharacterized protein YcgI (DUF1989 family)